MDDNKMWVTVYRLVAGWKAVLIMEEDGFPEPVSTGLTGWVDFIGARKEAEEWAKEEGVPLILPNPCSPDNEFAYGCLCCREYGCLMDNDKITCQKCGHEFSEIPSVVSQIAEALGGPDNVKLVEL